MSHIASTLIELEKAKSAARALELKVQAELPAELASLPTRYGFKTVAEFIKAVKKAYKGHKNSAKRTTDPESKPSKPVGRGRRKRTRARITDAIRATTKELVEAGKTGAAIAKELGISMQSVQMIKKGFGLVRARANVAADSAPPAAAATS